MQIKQSIPVTCDVRTQHDTDYIITIIPEDIPWSKDSEPHHTTPQPASRPFSVWQEKLSFNANIIYGIRT